MLIPCPECERKVSDRAAACPECGFPIREWLAEREQTERRERARATRERVGDVDCPSCEARGFVMFAEVDERGVERQAFTWCEDCEHVGRIHQCRDSEGFWAVSRALLDRFLAGEIDSPLAGLMFLGHEAATEHRYPRASEEPQDESEPAK
ncbi:hypothetical protein ACNOYE_30250 [Nannocystaceae bacterium ST9]